MCCLPRKLLPPQTMTCSALRAAAMLFHLMAGKAGTALRHNPPVIKMSSWDLHTGRDVREAAKKQFF